MSVSQSDTFIGPIITELQTIAAQITGIGRLYDEIPEGSPEDNSVMFACKHIDVSSAMNGRIEMTFEFDIIHCFRRTRLQEALTRAYAAMPAWATVLSTPANVRMSSSATLEDLTGIDIQNVKHGGQPMLGVICHIRVKKQFNIP
jgi:hypothetical protein